MTAKIILFPAGRVVRMPPTSARGTHLNKRARAKLDERHLDITPEELLRLADDVATILNARRRPAAHVDPIERMAQLVAARARRKMELPTSECDAR
ncbi:hypothetical protein KWH29_19780 [Xanthomonas campestris pv. paulliniae]|uniref:hypothetical protein n=1 Tax=Xanthomonas euvesicatoria TaxID=456327 RepID=UPI001C488BEC|nr:hypothetical protein [Xanthomonas euvesicatoria]MBV6847563.1 hypothetical protein [Xanthomonas campestris pv. paulliniae]